MYLVAALRKIVIASFGSSIKAAIRSMFDEHYIPILEKQVKRSRNQIERDANIKKLNEWLEIRKYKMWSNLFYWHLKQLRIHWDFKEEHESYVVYRILQDKESIYRNTDPLKMDTDKFVGFMSALIRRRLIDSIRTQAVYYKKFQQVEPPEHSYTPSSEKEYQELEAELLDYIKGINVRLYRLLAIWLQISKGRPNITLSDVIKEMAEMMNRSEPSIYSMFRQLREYVLKFFKEEGYKVPENLMQKYILPTIEEKVAYSEFKKIIGKIIST